MTKKIVFVVMLLLFDINAVLAEESSACTSDNINSLRVLLNDVDILYDVETETEDAFGGSVYDSYIVTVSGLPSEFYAVETDTNITVGSGYTDSVGENTYYFDGISSGKKTIRIYNNSCNEVIKSYTIKLPVYNYYYDDKICKGISISDVPACSQWIEEYISYDDLLATINNYKKDNKSFFNKIYDYLIKNYIYVIGVICILIIVIIITIILKKNKRKLI